MAQDLDQAPVGDAQSLPMPAARAVVATDLLLSDQKNLQGKVRIHDEVRDAHQFLEEVKKIQEYLSSLKIRGRISASAKVFAGVRVFIKDAHLEIRNEFSSVTFINEANLVKITKYEELEEDFVRKR